MSTLQVKPKMENRKLESKPFSVPIPLRRSVFYVCQWRPLGDLARLLYGFAAQSIGKSLFKYPSTKAVYLMGGSAHRIIPAMSDLDLLLFTEIDSEVVLNLRKEFLHLKKLYWIPGEIIPLDEKSLHYLEKSGCSLSIHLFGRTQKIVGDSVAINPTVRPDSKGLFMLLMRFFGKATQSVRYGSKNISSFDLLDCRRYLSKIIALNEGSQVTSYLSGEDYPSLSDLFYEAYSVLDKRAEALLKELFPAGVPIEITAYLAKQENIPEQRIFSAELPKEDILDLFQQALNAGDSSNLFPMCLSENSAICRLLGLTLESWSQVSSRLESIPRKFFIPILYEATRERAMRRYFQLPGDIMLNAEEDYRSKLNQFCRLGCYLVTEQYFADRVTLADTAETKLPVTVKVLRKTHQGTSKLPFKDLVESTIAVRNELEKVIFGF